MDQNESRDDRQRPRKRVHAFAPLTVPSFRNIWTASVLSNFGQLILGVGAAWEMTRLTDNSPTMVALVQSAMMIPLMLVTVPAGAIADMFDRRKVAIAGLVLSTLSAATLTALAFLGFITPWVLLGACLMIGAGVALYTPSWQSSVSELVPAPMLPPAVALGSVSYNIARTVGPAIGGIVVLAFGPQATFAMNAVFYLPLIIAFALWKRRHVPSRLPPERINRAIVSGARYAMHSPAGRTVLIRAFAFGFAIATATALAPLVAKDMLGGDAAIFGLLLGATGVGAVIGALFVSEVKERLGTERAVRLFALIGGGALAIVGASGSLPITLAGFFLVGTSHITVIALLNVTVQLAVPRWVVARALSLFTAALTGGLALGAWAWGELASQIGVGHVFIASGVACVLTALVGFVARLPDSSDNPDEAESVEIQNEPEVALALSMRSGPVVIEIDYDVDPADARAFYDAMLKVQSIRQRNGGFEWSLARDIANPACWTERYHCPTWGDYLRMRDRWTLADLQVHERASEFHRGKGSRQVRRRLERPFGSVRWRAESPDAGQSTMGVYAP